MPTRGRSIEREEKQKVITKYFAPKRLKKRLI